MKNISASLYQTALARQVSISGVFLVSEQVLEEK